MCGVLRLIEDYAGIVDAAAPHICQRGDFNRAGIFKTPYRGGSDERFHAVIQRPEVWIELLGKVTRKEAQTLAGFHDRTCQNQLLLPTAQ